MSAFRIMVKTGDTWKPLKPSGKKDKYLHIRCSSTDRLTWAGACKPGESLSEWVTRVLNEAAKKGKE